MGLLKVPNRTFQGSQTEAPLPGVLNGPLALLAASGSAGRTVRWEEAGSRQARRSPRAWPGPAAQALFGQSLRWSCHSGCSCRGTTACSRPPVLLPRPPGLEVGGLGRARSPGSRPGCGGLPGIAAQGMGEGFPSFCLYMAEARQRCLDGPTGPGRIVLRGCLASGSEALDSCKILAGKLFDSSDNVLESPREDCPGGPRARGAPGR